MQTVGTITDLHTIADPEERALAALAYITAREAAVLEARKIRNRAIWDLLQAGGGITDVARRCGVSLSTVKQVRLSGGRL